MKSCKLKEKNDKKDEDHTKFQNKGQIFSKFDEK